MTNLQRTNLVKAISLIPIQEREAVIAQVNQAVGSDMRGEDIRRFIQAISHLKSEERERGIASANGLYPERKDWEKKLRFLEMLGHEEIRDLTTDEKHLISLHASSLFPPTLASSKATGLLRVFLEIPLDEIGEVVAITRSLMDPPNGNPQIDLERRIEILDAVGSMRKEGRQTAISQAMRLFIPGMSGVVKAAILVLVGKCRPEKREGIVDQILSLYTPEMSETDLEFMVEMFRSIQDIRTEDRISLIEQARSLFGTQMSRETKLEILDLLAEVAHLPEAERLSIFNQVMILTHGMEFDCKITILRSLEQVAIEEREDVVRRSIPLLTSLMRGEEIGSILIALGSIPSLERADTIRYALSLVDQNIDGLGRKLILCHLNEIPFQDRADVVQHALTIITDEMVAMDRCSFLEAIATVSQERRTGTLEQARTLFTPDMEAEDQTQLIMEIDEFPLEEQSAIIERARALFNPEMEFEDLVSLLRGVGTIRPQERASVIEAAGPLFNPEVFQDRGLILKALGTISPEDRPLVVQSVQPICPPEMHHKERAEIVQVIQNMPHEDRNALIHDAAGFFLEYQMGYRSSILRALRSVPPEDRASVIEQTNRLIEPNMDHFNRAILLSAVSQVAPERRQEIIDQLLPIFTQGVSVYGKASLILAFGDLTAEERNGWILTLTELPSRERRADTKGQLSVNLQELSMHPLKGLERLLKKLKVERKFPKIKYEDSEGIDVGGLTRDFVTRLFQALCDPEAPKLSMKGTDLGLIPTFDQAQPLPSQFRSLQGVGMIFAEALRNHESIVVGNHFAPVLFEMLHALSDRDVARLPNQLRLLENYPIPEALYQKLLTIYLESQYPHLFGGPENPQLRAHILGFVEQGIIPEQLDGFDRETFLEHCQIDPIVRATLLIAKSIQESLEGKSNLDALKQESPSALTKQIQGSVSKEELLASLEWEGEDPQTQGFLQNWIQNATQNQIVDFVWAITGSAALKPSTKLIIHLYSENDKLPTFHTCVNTIDLPKGYGSQARFNEKLEMSLSSAQEGMQVA